MRNGVSGGEKELGELLQVKPWRAIGGGRACSNCLYYARYQCENCLRLFCRECSIEHDQGHTRCERRKPRNGNN